MILFADYATNVRIIFFLASFCRAKTYYIVRIDIYFGLLPSVFYFFGKAGIWGLVLIYTDLVGEKTVFNEFIKR